MFAAVDLGSNSFRLHIGEPDGSAMRIVRSARDPVRLAAGLQPDGSLSEAAVATALRCLAGFGELLREYHLDGVRVVATNTLRVATNAPAILPMLEAAVGYPIEIISGEEEGRLVYMGVDRALGRPFEARLVIDIGGGSTEVVVGRGSAILQVESFSIGTQPQSRYFPDGRIDEEGFEAAVLGARAVFEDAAASYRAHRWEAAYGSSGTMRAMAEVIARNGLGDGTMSMPGLRALRAAFVRSGHVDAFDLPGIKRERFAAVMGGTSVLIGAFEELGVERVEAVNAGLRLGVLTDLALRSVRQDRRAVAVEDCMRRFRADAARATRTAAIARALYRSAGAVDAASESLLEWACLLHEVGLAVSHTGAHKHGAYILENADLPGFTTREQRRMAMLVLGHKGNLRKLRDALDEPGFSAMLAAIRLAVACMHAGADDAQTLLRLRSGGTMALSVPRTWLARHPTLRAAFEKEVAAWAEVGRAMRLDLA